MGWLVFALPVAALAFLIVALVLNALRQYLISRAMTKKKKYSRNDVLRRRA